MTDPWSVPSIINLNLGSAEAVAETVEAVDTVFIRVSSISKSPSGIDQLLRVIKFLLEVNFSIHNTKIRTNANAAIRQWFSDWIFSERGVRRLDLKGREDEGRGLTNRPCCESKQSRWLRLLRPQIAIRPRCRLIKGHSHQLHCPFMAVWKKVISLTINPVM